MSEFLGDINSLRKHLIDTLVSFGRSEAGAARQVSDFEHAVRLAAIEETARGAQRRAQKSIHRPR